MMEVDVKSKMTLFTFLIHVVVVVGAVVMFYSNFDKVNGEIASYETPTVHHPIYV